MIESDNKTKLKRERRQNNNMALGGAIIGVVIGFFIYLGLASLLISFQLDSDVIDASGGHIALALNAIATLQQTAIFILTISLIIGTFLGFLLIPI